MAAATDTQIDLFAWARDLERENNRIAEINEERARRRGYLVFATDPSKDVDSADYQLVFATEARTRPPRRLPRLGHLLTIAAFGRS